MSIILFVSILFLDPRLIRPNYFPQLAATAMALCILFAWIGWRRLQLANWSVPLILGGFAIALAGIFSDSPSAQLYLDNAIKLLLFLSSIVVFHSTPIRTPALLAMGYALAFAATAVLTFWLLEVNSILTFIKPLSFSFFNRNLWSSYLVFWLPIIWFGLRKIQIKLALTCLGLTLAQVLISGHRASLLAMGFMCLLYLIYMRRNPSQRGILAGLVLLTLAATLLISFLPKKQTSLLQRPQIWQATWEMTLKHPAFGVGWGEWPIYSSLHGTFGLYPRGEAKYTVRAHNEPLQLVSEVGIPVGFVLLLGILIGSWKLGYFRQLRSSNEDPATGAAYSIAAYGIISLFSFPSESICHLTVLAFALSFLLPKPNGKSFKASALTVAPLTLLMLGVFVYTMLLWKNDFRSSQAIDYLRQGKHEEALQRLKQIEANVYPLEAGINPIGYYQGMVLEASRMPFEACEAFEQGFKVHPYHPFNLEKLKGCRIAKGDSDGAAMIDSLLEQIY